MIVEIDFTTDTIIRCTKLEQPDYITRFPAPDDYHPSDYTYIPEIPGQYDPNGFTKIETESPVDPFYL